MKVQPIGDEPQFYVFTGESDGKEISEPIIYTIPKDSSFVVEYARETPQKYGFTYILSIKDNKFIKDWIYGEDEDDFFKKKILEQYI